MHVSISINNIINIDDLVEISQENLFPINQIFRKFDAQDAGMYVGEIFIKKDGESYKCDVEVEIVLLGL